MLEIHLALHVPKSESLQLFDSRPQRLRPSDSVRLTRPTDYVYLHHPSPLCATLSRLTTEGPPMAPINHFAATAALTPPPLSFAGRTGHILLVSGTACL